MGNKQQKSLITDENIEKEVKQFINEGKTTSHYMKKTKINNLNTVRVTFHEKSRMEKKINSKTLIHCCFEIYSNLINTQIHRKINSTIINAVTIPKISDNNISSVNLFDFELLGNQSELLLEWINKVYLTNDNINYENWVPLPFSHQNLRFDNFEQNYSSIEKDDENYSDILENKELSLEKENISKKKNKNDRKITKPKISIKSKKDKPKVSASHNVVAIDETDTISPISSIKFNLISQHHLKERTKSSLLKPDFDQKTVNSILKVMNVNHKKFSTTNPINSVKNSSKNKTKGKDISNNYNDHKQSLKLKNYFKKGSTKENKEKQNYEEKNILSTSQAKNNFQTDDLSPISPPKNGLLNLPTFKYIANNETKENTVNNIKRNSVEEINFSNIKANDKNIENVVKLNINNNLKNTQPTKKADNKLQNKITEINVENIYESKHMRKNRNKSRSVSTKKGISVNYSKNNQSHAVAILRSPIKAYTQTNTKNHHNTINDKEKRFADLILQNVSPLNLLNNKDNIEEDFPNLNLHKNEKNNLGSPLQFKISPTNEKKNIKKNNKNLKKKTLNKEDFTNENPNVKHHINKLDKKTNHITIDIRNLLDDLDDFKSDSSKTSNTLLHLNERSKSKEVTIPMRLAYKTATNSDKLLPEVMRVKKNRTSLRRPRMLKSSIDTVRRLRTSEENKFLFNDENSKNVNVNININSNNINNFNNYSNSALCLRHNIGRKHLKSSPSLLNMKKLSHYRYSKVNSINMGNLESQKNFNYKDYLVNLEIPKFYLDLSPLDQTDLHYSEILKLLKENNKFLFEVTNEEKQLNDKIKAFNYVENGNDSRIKE